MISAEDLIAIASVGTTRKAASLSGGSGPLADALATIEQSTTTSAEATLLGAFAILTQYEICGRIPASQSAAAEASGAETQPHCSRRAGDLLGQILAMTNTQTKDRLVAEWLEHASSAGQRAPWRLLPELFEYGVAHRARREGIVQASGARGSWLMSQNPRWQYAAGPLEDPGNVWSTGSRDQRLSALARLRQTDPQAALALVQSTWKEDPADERAAFVAALATSLSASDEPFLESALDDRSKQVRAAAADLLQRLSGSALSARMIERAQPLLVLQRDRSSRPRIQITLPPEKLDPSWERDGVIEKPETRAGRRQWWLLQIIAAIPPSHWSGQWKLSPGECVAALVGDFADVVLEGLHQAARRHPDPAWIAALLRAAAIEGRGPLTLDLLAHLPPAERERLTTDILNAPNADTQQAASLLRELPFPLGRDAASALIGLIERSIEQRPLSGYDYLTAQVLQEAVCRVPGEMHDELATKWIGQRWDQVHKARDEFLQTLQLRRDLSREFKSAKTSS